MQWPKYKQMHAGYKPLLLRHVLLAQTESDQPGCMQQTEITILIELNVQTWIVFIIKSCYMYNVYIYSNIFTAKVHFNEP